MITFHGKPTDRCCLFIWPMNSFSALLSFLFSMKSVLCFPGNCKCNWWKSPVQELTTLSVFQCSESLRESLHPKLSTAWRMLKFFDLRQSKETFRVLSGSVFQVRGGWMCAAFACGCQRWLFPRTKFTAILLDKLYLSGCSAADMPWANDTSFWSLSWYIRGGGGLFSGNMFSFIILHKTGQHWYAFQKCRHPLFLLNPSFALETGLLCGNAFFWVQIIL